MSAACDFIDETLQRESSWERATQQAATLDTPHDTGTSFYGASVGAVRGVVRDASRKFPGLSHDEITALSSELWAVPVFERRLAAVVLLQTHVDLLLGSDLTRLEGFVRSAGLDALIDPLALDVIAPLVNALDARARAHASVAVDRWSREENESLRRAALLVASLEREPT